MDLGHSVLEAPSAAHAIKLLETDGQFDVMITDYAMPGMTGLDLATKVKQFKPKLPIVLATGYAELPPHALIGFPRLDKPYTQEQLAEALNVAIRREGWCRSHSNSGGVECHTVTIGHVGELHAGDLIEMDGGDALLLLSYGDYR
jgi:CheY-like chemotaxis protein